MESPTAVAQHVDTLIEAGRTHELNGLLTKAEAAYRSAIASAEPNTPGAKLSEAWRLLAVVLHRRQRRKEADDCVARAYELAQKESDAHRCAEALNTMGSFALARGDLAIAEKYYEQALPLATSEAPILARIHQNLGIVANIRGTFDSALRQYSEALAAYRSLGDAGGCLMACHNLGMISVDLKRLDEAQSYFERALELAKETKQSHVRAVCLISYCEVFLARREFSEAQRRAEEALEILNTMGETRERADALTVLGVVARETEQYALGEDLLRRAVSLAADSNAMWTEAEALRELALLEQRLGRNQDALNNLNAAHQLFQHLGARIDLGDVAGRVVQLESTYLAIVHAWGRSIETADSYTRGHSAQVAEYACAIADILGLSAEDKTTLRIGSYLHDVGKVRIPLEILNKPGTLTADEYTIMKRHPEYGVQLLAAVAFPWNVIPIIRWHHEKWDGSGYPDGLAGDAVPLHAQIVCAADVYDALTSVRAYRGAMSHEQACAVMTEKRSWWRPNVFEAAMRAFARSHAERERLTSL